MFCRLLKLMLGIAVTCANRQTFIAKIQSLDAETQHSLTQSAASFIIVKVPGANVCETLSIILLL